mgnify:CR=1 FL=1
MKKLLATKELKPGMVLGEDVKNFQGVLLLKNGTFLDEKKIKLLKTWGVDLVSVISQENDTNSTNTEKVSQTIKLLEHRFSPHNENPLMQKLKEIGIEYVKWNPNNE